MTEIEMNIIEGVIKLAMRDLRDAWRPIMEVEFFLEGAGTKPQGFQIVAPGEEPRFFDDLSCLSSWIGAGHVLPSGARIFVADHRTSSWVPADLAVFTRVPGLETPMGSGIVAHESEASRNQDDAARGGSPVPPREVLVGQAGSGT